MQRRIWDYHAPEDTELLNHRFKGIIRFGVHSGFEVENGTPGFVIIRAGVLVTADGVRIEETDDLIDLVSIPPNNGGNPRIDYIVCRHEYVKTVPPPVATYSVISGTPATSPEPPVLTSGVVILARGLLPEGANAYSVIKLATPDEVFNAIFDGHDWRIVYGNKSAYRIEHDINDNAIRFSIIPAGTYPNGSIISWPAPVMTLSDFGHQELLQEVSDRQGADSVLQGNINAEASARATADAVLQANINSEASARSSADSTLQSNIDGEASTRASQDNTTRSWLADAKGRAWNATVPANEDMAEMADRLDSLEAASGVPAHRTRHESGGDDVVRFDQLADGSTYKKMLATERTKLAGIEAGAEVNNLTDAQATDLTDGGESTAHRHDGRYYTETETNALLAGKSDTSHVHDDRYFTETESDGRFAPIVHNHDARYFTETESDARFAAIGHLHDSRYLRLVASDSKTVDDGTTENFVTGLADRPPVVTWSFLLPTNNDFNLHNNGGLTGFTVFSEKVDSNNYRVGVNNQTGIDLYFSVFIWEIG